MLGISSQSVKDRLKIEYKRKDAEVKRNVRKDKRACVDSKACEAEEAAKQNELWKHRVILKNCVGGREINLCQSEILMATC